MQKKLKCEIIFVSNSTKAPNEMNLKLVGVSYNEDNIAIIINNKINATTKAQQRVLLVIPDDDKSL